MSKTSTPALLDNALKIPTPLPLTPVDSPVRGPLPIPLISDPEKVTIPTSLPSDNNKLNLETPRQTIKAAELKQPSINPPSPLPDQYNYLIPTFSIQPPPPAQTELKGTSFETPHSNPVAFISQPASPSFVVSGNVEDALELVSSDEEE